MIDIVNYLKNTLSGLIILGILSSITATIIYNVCKRQLIIFSDFIKRKFRVNKLNRIINYYINGYAAGHANKSSYHQIVFVGDFIIKVVVQIGWILATLSIFTSLFILIEKPFSWILVIFSSTIITLQYKKLKTFLTQYGFLLEKIFGEEFFEKQNEATKKYVEKVSKNKVQ